MASLSEKFIKCIEENKKITELSDEDLKDTSGGSFVDHAFGVIYYSQSEWDSMSSSQRDALRLFFGGDYRLVVLDDDQYEEAREKYNR